MFREIAANPPQSPRNILPDLLEPLLSLCIEEVRRAENLGRIQELAPNLLRTEVREQIASQHAQFLLRQPGSWKVHREFSLACQ